MTMIWCAFALDVKKSDRNADKAFLGEGYMINFRLNNVTSGGKGDVLATKKSNRK